MSTYLLNYVTSSSHSRCLSIQRTAAVPRMYQSNVVILALIAWLIARSMSAWVRSLFVRAEAVFGLADSGGIRVVLYRALPQVGRRVLEEIDHLSAVAEAFGWFSIDASRASKLLRPSGW